MNLLNPEHPNSCLGHQLDCDNELHLESKSICVSPFGDTQVVTSCDERPSFTELVDHANIGFPVIQQNDLAELDPFHLRDFTECPFELSRDCQNLVEV
jgi:hypothetical protein